MCLNPYNNKGGKRQGGCHTTSNSTSRALYIILYVCLLNNISPFRFLSYKRKINNQNKILKKNSQVLTLVYRYMHTDVLNLCV